MAAIPPGARDLGSLGRTHAWKRADGIVELDGRPVGKGDRLVASFGGMSSAIGIVEMDVTLHRADGTRDELYRTGVDEQMTDLDARNVYAEMLNFFRGIAAEAGCRFEEA